VSFWEVRSSSRELDEGEEDENPLPKSQLFLLQRALLALRLDALLQEHLE
jgi:hypothetical protein